MRAPEPSSREVRWAFYVVAACGLLLTVTLCWGIVHRVNQSDDIVHIAASNADTVQRLNDQIDQLNVQLAKQDRAADRQRTVLRRQNRALHHQLDVLVDFLRAHGLPVPQVVTSASRGSGGGGSEPSKRPTAEPTGPGNSGTHANPNAEPGAERPAH